MEKPRSLFWKVIGHKMFFVAFLLFPTDILAQGQAVSTTYAVNHTVAAANLSLPSPAFSNVTGKISMKPVTSHPDATTSSATSQQPVVSIQAKPPVSEQELQSTSAVDAAVLKNASFLVSKPPVLEQELQSTTAVDAAVSKNASLLVPSKAAVSTKEKDPRTETTGVQKLKPQEEVFSKATVAPHFHNKSASPPPKDVGTRSQGTFFDRSPGAIETTKSTQQKEDRKRPIPPGQAELTQSPETGIHYTPGPLITTVASISTIATHGMDDASSKGKKHPIIILAIVFGIVLLAGLIVFLYLRRRRHSGSTSFNSPEWAGQATLPDDTGLDKDLEQQAGSAGEGETRRGTLVTFFGKRQSRVPSIAMEDVNGKGGKAEREQLLSGEAEVGSPSEAIGDANGKVPAPLKGSSPESPAS